MVPPVTVLLADDHDHYRSGLARMLTREPGLDLVAQATDGRDALRLIRKHRPRVAAVDLRMPSLDGLGVARLVREDPDLDDVRVVVLTARNDEDLHAEVTQAGASACLDKAARRRALRDELLRVAERRQRDVTSMPPVGAPSA